MRDQVNRIDARATGKVALDLLEATDPAIEHNDLRIGSHAFDKGSVVPHTSVDKDQGIGHRATPKVCVAHARDFQTRCDPKTGLAPQLSCNRW